jgi:Holliday junction resolvase
LPSSSPKRKGTRAEVELARLLWERGYAVVRGPSSGGGVRRRFQPDIVAMKNGVILVIEVKTARRPGDPVYVESHKVLGLEEFARRAGARPLIGVRVKGGEWRFHELSSLKVTRGGNFKVERASSGMRLRDLDELARGGPRITDFM